jgi:hypothetical protein
VGEQRSGVTIIHSCSASSALAACAAGGRQGGRMNKAKENSQWISDARPRV